MRVAAIVPARNEADRIGVTVKTLREVVAIDEIIVVDDGSADATSRLAVAAGAEVVRLPRRMGKGGAIAAGLARTDTELVVLVDADLGTSASIAAELLDPVIAGDADMTIAAPPASEPSGFGLVESLARWGIRRLTGRTMSRPLSGQRALRREVVEPARLARAFGVEVGLTIDALRRGLRVVEIPAVLRHRRTGRTMAGFSHRARQGFDVAVALASRAIGWGRR